MKIGVKISRHCSFKGLNPLLQLRLTHIAIVIVFPLRSRILLHWSSPSYLHFVLIWRSGSGWPSSAVATQTGRWVAKAVRVDLTCRLQARGVGKNTCTKGINNSLELLKCTYLIFTLYLTLVTLLCIFVFYFGLFTLHICILLRSLYFAYLYFKLYFRKCLKTVLN